MMAFRSKDKVGNLNCRLDDKFEEFAGFGHIAGVKMTCNNLNISYLLKVAVETNVAR